MPRFELNSRCSFGCCCCLCRPSGTRINCSSGRKGFSQFMKPIKASYIITLDFYFIFISILFFLHCVNFHNNNVRAGSWGRKKKKKNWTSSGFRPLYVFFCISDALFGKEGEKKKTYVRIFAAPFDLVRTAWPSRRKTSKRGCPTACLLLALSAYK